MYILVRQGQLNIQYITFFFYSDSTRKFKSQTNQINYWLG